MKRQGVKNVSIDHAFEQMLMSLIQLGVDIGFCLKFHLVIKDK